MKKLILITILFLAPTLRAQSTNITLNAIVVELAVDGITVTRSNLMNINVSAKMVKGFNITWERDNIVAAQQTNAAPTFRVSVKNEIAARIQSLEDIADADAIQRSKVNALVQNIKANWAVMSPADQADLATLAAKYNP